MIMLTVVHICRAAHWSTLHSGARAIKGRLMVSWVTSCICITPAGSLGVMVPALLPLVGPITLLLSTRRMEPLKGNVERLLGKFFSHPFSMFYS
jgi:hypothetical protein